jgi:hypothetical protein
VREAREETALATARWASPVSAEGKDGLGVVAAAAEDSVAALGERAIRGGPLRAGDTGGQPDGAPAGREVGGTAPPVDALGSEANRRVTKTTPKPTITILGLLHGALQIQCLCRDLTLRTSIW